MKEPSSSSQRVVEFPSHGKRPRFCDFGPFRLDTHDGQLFRDGALVPLTPKAIDLLVFLVRHPGQLLPKEMLLSAVWPDTYVDESNLTQHIFLLRKALGGNGRSAYIETIPKRGFRFIAPVAESDEALTQPALVPPTRRRLAWATALAALAVAPLLVLLGTRVLQREDAPVRTIAVLPFEHLGPREDDYIGLALTDAVITRLGYSGAVTVRPTAAVLSFTGTKDPIAAGRRLGVDAVLTGTAQRRGDAVRIAAQLVRVDGAALIWSRTFDSSNTDLFALQDSLAQSVINVVSGKSAGAPPAVMATSDREAYEAYLKGRYHWNKRTAVGFGQARQWFQIALKRDPRFAPAWAGLADVHNSTAEANQAKVAARQALAIDPNLAEAYAALGNAALFHGFEWDSAERSLKRAVSLNPSYATAHHWLAYCHAARGRFEEALAEIERAREIDPLSLVINTDVGHILYLAGRHDDALAQFRSTLDLDPNFPNAHFARGNLLMRLGRKEEALAAMRTGFALVKRPAHLADAYNAKTPQELDRVVSAVGRTHAPYHVAALYASFGRVDEAMKRLESCYTTHDANLALVAVDPALDRLRGSRRFHDFTARLGLSGVDAGTPRRNENGARRRRVDG